MVHIDCTADGKLVPFNYLSVDIVLVKGTEDLLVGLEDSLCRLCAAKVEVGGASSHAASYRCTHDATHLAAQVAPSRDGGMHPV